MLDHSQPGPCLTARHAVRSRPCDAIDNLRKACAGVSAERAQHEADGGNASTTLRNRYTAWTSRPEPARRAADHSVLLALLLTATGVAAEARCSGPWVPAVSTILLCFCVVYLLGRGGPASTRKPAERRHTASAGFAIDSTRRISEPGLAASGFTVSECAGVCQVLACVS